MRHVISAKGLTHRFGGLAAVKGLGLEIPAGTVSAFLGPNGAGKTTAIRLLLGLLKVQEGTCEVLGYPPGHPQGLAQIGALVETPSLYEHLTGRENVRVTQLLRGLPRSEVDRVLSQVGLLGDANRPVSAYSLGMRQRLGLALALLGEPQLLILDEPTNGMDPAGIHEMRELLLRLPSTTGAAVFLSSHLLAEVEQVAEYLVIINKGGVRYQGSLEEFRAGEGPRLRVRTGDVLRTETCLASLGFRATVEGKHLAVKAQPTDAPKIAAALIEAGVDLYELAPEHASLESRFLALLEQP